MRRDFNIQTSNDKSTKEILTTLVKSRYRQIGGLLFVKLIGVNKGGHVTLKYFSILINVNRKHRVYMHQKNDFGPQTACG